MFHNVKLNKLWNNIDWPRKLIEFPASKPSPDGTGSTSAPPPTERCCTWWCWDGSNFSYHHLIVTSVHLWAKNELRRRKQSIQRFSKNLIIQKAFRKISTLDIEKYSITCVQMPKDRMDNLNLVQIWLGFTTINHDGLVYYFKFLSQY